MRKDFSGYGALGWNATSVQLCGEYRPSAKEGELSRSCRRHLVSALSCDPAVAERCDGLGERQVQPWAPCLLTPKQDPLEGSDHFCHRLKLRNIETRFQ